MEDVMSDYQQKYFEEKFSDIKSDLSKINYKLEWIEKWYATKDLLVAEFHRALEKIDIERKRIDKVYSVAWRANKIILGAILMALLALVIKTWNV